ncbi:hypothetical protein ABE10_01475, partial [Bacillus toyonensis]|nr:hypothetical protein [Bacillus toyonensis]
DGDAGAVVAAPELGEGLGVARSGPQDQLRVASGLVCVRDVRGEGSLVVAHTSFLIGVVGALS